MSATEVPVVAATVTTANGDSIAGSQDGKAPSTTPAMKPQPDSAVLKLKGLPYSTTEQQILDFFQGFQVKKVAFVGEPDGRPSGLAFAEFEDKEEAIKALAKNGEYIGERYVRLLHVPKSEMEEQVRLGTLAIPGAAAKLRSRLMRQQRNNLTYLAGPQLLVPTAVVPGTGRGPMVAASINQGAYGNGAVAGHAGPMDARVWPNYPNQVALNQQFGNMQLGTGPHQPGMAPRGPAPGMVHQQHQLAPMGAGQGLPTPSAQILNSTARAVQNPTSATVKVRGLPYRSSPAEILTFFQGYQYLPDSLQIGLDSLGRPSGEAWLTFINPQEAMRGVRDLNRHYLGNRYLELSIC